MKRYIKLVEKRLTVRFLLEKLLICSFCFALLCFSIEFRDTDDGFCSADGVDNDVAAAACCGVSLNKDDVTIKYLNSSSNIDCSDVDKVKDNDDCIGIYTKNRG
jgi:hypothetical protein